MTTFFAENGNITYKRITKRQAQKWYETGKDIILCPVKLYPFGDWRTRFPS